MASRSHLSYSDYLLLCTGVRCQASYVGHHSLTSSSRELQGQSDTNLVCNMNFITRILREPRWGRSRLESLARKQKVLFSNPKCDRPKSINQEVTTPQHVPNARQKL